MRRGRPVLAALLGALILTGPGQAAAGDGSPEDPFVITVVTWRGWTAVEDGFVAGFRDAGLSVDIRHRDVERDRSRFPALIAEIKADPPDLVYSWGTGPALALSGRYDAADPQAHITETPHVFTMVTTPQGAKLTESLAGSGRHVTGTSHVADVEAQLRAIQAYLPVARLGVLYNPAESNMLWTMERLREAAPRLGLELVERAAPLDEDGKAIGGEALTARLQEIAAEGVDALYIGPDSYIGAWGALYAEEAKRLRLPSFAATERVIREHGVMAGLVSSYVALGRFTAFKAKQILVEGRDPGTIPIETLSRFSYVVNIDTARAVASYPPLPLLRFAEIVGAEEPAW
ncbi:MAG: ABC transporter substrate-binding protein [Marivibrio sp.]|uniref:ABC transporter substrate-binding protein n=1 Tax=Marivibrio sp. TaxID=2039719 RepID=UPI0032EFF29B